MARSNIKYLKESADFIAELHFSEIARLLKYGTDFSPNKVLLVLKPFLNRALNDFQSYSTDKDLKIIFRVNLQTLVVTVVAITTVGVVSYTYGVIPAIGLSAATATIYYLSRRFKIESKIFPNLASIKG